MRLATTLSSLPPLQLLLLLLLLLATLLPSVDALFNFGVDLYADLKGRAPFGGGPVS